jgi:RNA polymerase sigma-70 factor (ECF subfamily)
MEAAVHVKDGGRGPARLRVVKPEDADTPAPALPDPYGLDALYRRYAPYVASIGTRLLGRDGEVDDLVQDVFIEALRGISKVRDPNAIKGWLARVTVRASVRRLRKRRWLQTLHLEIDPGGYEHLAGRSATPEQRALIAKVYRVLDRLPARTRVIWTLRHVLDEPLHSIVELTACSQSTVQRRLRDAEAVLEKELHDE